MPTPCWLKHLCSIRALVPVYFSVCLSLFFSLIPWSAEALWVHFPARASKTLSIRCSAPSPHQEGTWGLHEQSKSRIRGFLGFLCKPRNISLFLSFTFLSSTPDHQVPSIKGPQHQQILAIWSLVPLPFLNPAWTSRSSQFTYCWSLAWRILNITLLTFEMTAVVW